MIYSIYMCVCVFVCVCVFSSVQSLSHVRPFATPWTVAHQASLSVTSSHRLLKLTSIELVILSSHLNFCCSLLLLPSISPSIRVFCNKTALHIRCPKYWSFSFSVSHSNDYSRLISFWLDWFDLLAVQGTLKSFLQHYCSKASWIESRILHLKKHVFKCQNITCLQALKVQIISCSFWSNCPGENG